MVQECASAQNWVGTCTGDVLFEGARFLNEGRAGLRLPNYQHINATYQKQIHYGKLKQHASSMQQPHCFTPSELAPTPQEEDEADMWSAASILQTLIPATQVYLVCFSNYNHSNFLGLIHIYACAQVVFESPLVSNCWRYVIEKARAKALDATKMGPSAKLQASAWKRRCEAKIREASVCNFTGVYFNTAPPANWQDIATKTCGITLRLQDAPSATTDTVFLASRGGGERVYMTPGCIAVDRITGIMYDTRLCIKQAASATATTTTSTTTLTSWNSLNSDCALVPQPLSLLMGDVPYSMLFQTGGTRLSDDWLSNLSPLLTIETIDTQAAAATAATRDHVSHVLDWWPSIVNPSMPRIINAPGFHPTAASDPSELAPILYDSHYMYDPSTFTCFYVHSAARNASLLFNTMGAAGICRTPQAGMPMFNANTNRVCTRMALSAKNDTPHMPIQQPKSPGGKKKITEF